MWLTLNWSEGTWWWWGTVAQSSTGPTACNGRIRVQYSDHVTIVDQSEACITGQSSSHQGLRSCQEGSASRSWGSRHPPRVSHCWHAQYCCEWRTNERRVLRVLPNERQVLGILTNKRQVLPVYEGHGAEEEVREQHPVDDGGAQDGEHWEHCGQVRGPGPQQQATQVIELRYLMRLT